MQTNNKILMLMAVAALSLSCSSNSGKNTNEAPISKPQIEFTGDVMTPELLWSMGRLSDIQVSPDKKTILYGVSYYSITQNKGNRELYVVDLEGNQRKQLTQTAVSEAAAQWSADGKKIFFLSSVSGSSQLWQMLPDGIKPKRLTSVEGGIEAFRFSPDGKKLLYIAQVKYGKRAADYYPDLDKTSGRIIDDLMYKHWDEWVESIPHPFVADFSSRGLSNVRDLLQDEPFESPMKPWGGIEQLAWSPDGKTVAYTCRKKTGVDYSRSTNSDIYLCYLEENYRTENITAELPGYDTNPVFSPCGGSLAFCSMSRDGYESDKNRLMVYELNTGKMKDLTVDFDQEANSVVWADDAQS
ncbi:MAG: peptidase S9, partial [Bacteroidales bacterium]